MKRSLDDFAYSDLRIQFVNEIGDDWGGLTNEWLSKIN